LAAEQVMNYPLVELAVDQSLGPRPPRELSSGTNTHSSMQIEQLHE